jgi:hypothetical protein
MAGLWAALEGQLAGGYEVYVVYTLMKKGTLIEGPLAGGIRVVLWTVPLPNPATEARYLVLKAYLLPSTALDTCGRQLPRMFGWEPAIYTESHGT